MDKGEQALTLSQACFFKIGLDGQLFGMMCSDKVRVVYKKQRRCRCRKRGKKVTFYFILINVYF